MQCPECDIVCRRFGRDRHGRQRFQCPTCRRTLLDPNEFAVDGRRLPLDRAEFVLRMLLEGMSIRSTMRLTGVDKGTILRLLVWAGEHCQRFLQREIRSVEVNDVQCDEIWGFVAMKEKTRLRHNRAEIFGDAYCFTSIERDTKLMIAWHLGKRCPEDTRVFARKLHDATNGRFQLTTDGFSPYRTAMPAEFNRRIDFATLVKHYDTPADEPGRRYSPPEVVGTTVVVCCGHPDPDRICTSHIERSNLSMRMSIRRLTRLTNAFSKKWENHEAALALFFAFYNYCRPHMTLTEERARKTTPAMASGLADRVWSVRELLEAASQR